MFKPGINYRQMAEQQERDTETNAYRDSVTNLQWTELDRGGVSLLCDTSHQHGQTAPSGLSRHQESCC